MTHSAKPFALDHFVPRNLAPGEKISEDGVYNITLEQHHSDNCVGPSISSSGLRDIDARCPLYYWAFSYLNPKGRKYPETDAMKLGSAAHHLILGEADFRSKFATIPEEFPDFKTKAAREWRDAQIAAGRSVLSRKEEAAIVDMADALMRHDLIVRPDGAPGLLHGVVEQSLVWKDKETGVWLKTRPDVIPTGSRMIADLKTCSNADAWPVRQTIEKRGYHIQMWLAGEGFRQVLGWEMEDFVPIFVETAYPNLVNTKPLGAGAMHWGELQARAAIRKFAECMSSGHWPGLADDTVTAELSPSYIKQQEYREKSGEFGFVIKREAST